MFNLSEAIPPLSHGEAHSMLSEARCLSTGRLVIGCACIDVAQGAKAAGRGQQHQEALRDAALAAIQGSLPPYNPCDKCPLREWAQTCQPQVAELSSAEVEEV